MKKLVKVMMTFALAAMVTTGIGAASDVQAATKGVQSVSITSPAKVNAGKTKSYTLYQVANKKASVKVKAKIKVKGKTSKAIYFRSSNTKIAKVGKTSGKVTTTGRRYGTVNITAYAKANKSKKATIKLTVKKFAPTIDSSKLTTSVEYAGTAVSAGKVSLKSRTGVKSVAYTSSNKNVLTVDGNGNVTVVGAGNAYISAKVTSKTGAAKTVKSATVTVTEFSASLADTTMQIATTGEAATGKLAVTGSSIKSATYALSGTSEKAVDVTGKVVDAITVASDGTITAVAPTTATVTADVTSTNGAKKALTAKVTVTKAYTNVAFDYAAEIAAYNAKSTACTVPAAAEIPVSVADAKGADGVVLVKSHDTQNATDYYLNAYVAGNALNFTGTDITAVTSQIGEADPTDVTVTEGTSFTITPATINAAEPVDQIITVTAGGVEYKIHTVNEYMPKLNIATIADESPVEGVYTFNCDGFFFRVNTDKELVYFRNMLNTWTYLDAEVMTENFKTVPASTTEDGKKYYTYFLELNTTMRQPNGGYSSGEYVIMDENYKEINYVTLEANTDATHTHGEGYLDQHEFQLYSADHWISLSYTPLLVNNLPAGVEGLNGTSSAYVQAGIIQEVKDGKVVHEYNTADYPLLYRTATEKTDYANSADAVANADDYMDYVHVNSVAIDPADGNIIVSMRDQYAVYKFARNDGVTDGNIMWILGGKANMFAGLDEYIDDNGYLFIGQHYAQYVDSSVAGNNTTISVFDNQTGAGFPFLDTKTRTMKIDLDTTNMTATADVINGADLDVQTGKNHMASHCGSVEYQAVNSTVIGWGLHATIDSDTLVNTGNPAWAQMGIGSRPIFSEYNPQTEKVNFELSVTRNALFPGHEACFAYRTYKTAD